MVKDVKLTTNEGGEELPEAAKEPSSTVGIWHLQLDSDGSLIKHIWFLRQLSADETHCKVQTETHLTCLVSCNAFRYFHSV